MDHSWFDVADDLGFRATHRSVLESRSRWTSTTTAGAGDAATHSVSTSASRRRSYLVDEATRDLDDELQATSARLREASRAVASSAHGGFLHDAGFATRRLGLARRFDDLMRNAGEGGRYQISSADDDVTKKLQAIKEENQKLQAVITDVTEVNKRWQKYNNDRQMYVQRLLSTIQDQQEEINKTGVKQVHSSKEEDSMESNGVVSEKCRLQEEVKQQRSRLEGLEKEYREHVAVLEFQVKAHRDDWEAERSEKQQLLKDKMAADAKVKQLQKDVRCLKLKLREERLENANQCSCAGCPSCETEHRMTQSARLSPCQRDHATQNKMYRTSVHLPCTSGHLLPRGTTLCFGDDLVIDSEEVTNNLDKQEPTIGVLRSRSNSEEDSEMSVSNNIEQISESKEEQDVSACTQHSNLRLESRSAFEPNEKSNRNGIRDEANELWKPLESNNPTVYNEKVYQSASTPNLITSTTPRLNCSVLHITPSSSATSTASALDSAATDSATDLATGVTIGFNNGLASVFSFPQSPIVKSFSLPTSKHGENKGTSFECEVPFSQTSSLGSSWSGMSIASPPAPAYTTSSESLFQDKKNSKLSVLGAYAKSMKQAKESVRNVEQSTSGELEQTAIQKTLTWKAKYFEDGVDTQTKEDLICPGCGQIFPPILHVTFLDHFEKCQNSRKEHQFTRKKSS